MQRLRPLGRRPLPPVGGFSGGEAHPIGHGIAHAASADKQAHAHAARDAPLRLAEEDGPVHGRATVVCEAAATAGRRLGDAIQSVARILVCVVLCHHTRVAVERPWRRTSGYHPLRKLRHAWSGIRHAVLLDFSVQYKLVVSVVFLAIAGVFETLFHFLFVLAVTGIMLAAEVFNTVVEAICDYVQPDHDERIRNIKDMAAGATYITIVIWYVVLGVVLYELISMNERFVAGE